MQVKNNRECVFVNANEKTFFSFLRMKGKEMQCERDWISRLQ